MAHLPGLCKAIDSNLQAGKEGGRKERKKGGRGECLEERIIFDKQKWSLILEAHAEYQHGGLVNTGTAHSLKEPQCGLPFNTHKLSQVTGAGLVQEHSHPS